MTAPAEQQAESLSWLSTWLVMNHQDEQRSIAERLVRRLIPLWKLLDFRNLKATQTPWIEATLPVVEAAYRESQRVAQQFVIDYRHANLPAAPELPAITGGPVVDLRHGGLATPSAPARVSTTPDRLKRGNVWVSPKVIEDTPFPASRAAVSLLGTGPGEITKRMPAPEEDVSRAARALSSRVAVRIAIDGGRQVVRRAVDLDHEAIGWARVLNVNPCAFCAMLAARGAVYKDASFAASNQLFEGEGVAKVHAGCRCGLRPVYSRSDSRDPTAQALWDEWGTLTSGEGGPAAINAFRRGYKPPPPPAAPRIDLHSLIVQRDKLIRDGFGEDSGQVAWMDQQIARFGALL